MIKCIALSDIHLGSDLVPTEAIIHGLNNLLPDDGSLIDIDLLILAGDVFDKQLWLPNEVVSSIQLWIMRILFLCKKYDIKLRVLEGTPSHDARQSKQFIILNEGLQIGADVKYHDTLEIDYINIRGKDYSFLYLPDEYHSTAAVESAIEIKSLLDKASLKTVHFVVMHGAFTYQLPIHSPNFHDMAFYLSICEYYIIVGHIHKMSTYERILAPGSTHRIGHGYEEPKGMFKLTITDHGNYVEFIENIWASQYKTIRIGNLTVDKAEKLLQKVIKTLVNNNKAKDKVHIKVITKSRVHIDVIKTFQTLYPSIDWNIDFESTEVKKSGDISKLELNYININKNTISGIMQKRLVSVDEKLKELSLELLEMVK